KKNYTWLYIVIGLIIVGLIAGVMMKSRSGDDVLSVEVETVEKRTIKELVSASGKVFPEIEVGISSDVSGEVVELYVEEGDSVKVGQLLAKVDPEVFVSAVDRVQASVDNSKAQVANARANEARSEAALQQSIAQKKQIQAQIENARAVFQRNDKLLADGVISQADYDTAKSSLRSLEANIEAADATIASSRAGLDAAAQTVKAAQFSVKSAEASLKETRTNLNRTSIFAPMSGVVSKLSIEKGERVVGTAQMTGTEIMRVADLSKMEVQVDVSESDVLRVNRGDEVEIEVDAYLDRMFQGKVTEIANSASNTGSTMSLTTDQVTNFTVKIRINPESYKDLLGGGKRFPFRPGMSASVDINTKTQKDIIAVPIQAVTTREGEDKNKDGDEEIKEVIFVMQGDSVSMKEVKTGIQDDSYIEVLSGISLNDEIVTGPYTAVSKKLEDGIEVKKKEEDE
ncbi:MAG: HlyD family secretion protein, partial [Saprospiraceae bacterium]